MCSLLKQVSFLEKTIFAVQHSTLASFIYMFCSDNSFPVYFASPHLAVSFNHSCTKRKSEHQLPAPF